MEGIALEEDQVWLPPDGDVPVVVAIAGVGARVAVAADVLPDDEVVRVAVGIYGGIVAYLKTVGLECLNLVDGVGPVVELKRIVPGVVVNPPNATAGPVALDPYDRGLPADRGNRAVIIAVTGVRADLEIVSAVILEGRPVVGHTVGVDHAAGANLEAISKEGLDGVGEVGSRAVEVGRVACVHRGRGEHGVFRGIALDDDQVGLESYAVDIAVVVPVAGVTAYRE